MLSLAVMLSNFGHLTHFYYFFNFFAFENSKSSFKLVSKNQIHYYASVFKFWTKKDIWNSVAHIHKLLNLYLLQYPASWL